MNRKTPEIRFGGYTDAWEERKLRELVESFEYGLNSAAIPFDGENKYLRITDIDDSSNLFKQDSLTSPDADLKISDNYLLKKGDVLFARTGASVGKTYRYQENDGKVYYAGFLIRARINSQFDSEFIFQNTLTSSYNNFIKVTSQRSGQPGVNAKEYGEFEIYVPSLLEQQKIGAFFKSLDDTIALQERKLKLLKEQKKAYLQKMFPKQGEKIPELRFQGFTDAWEERKLGEVAKDISDGDWIEKEHIFDDGEYRIIQTGNLGEGEYLDKPNNAKYFYQKDFDEIKANEIFAGDLLISRLAEPAGRTIILPATNHRMVTAVDVTIIRPDDSFDSTFLMTQMNSSQTLNKVGKSVSGTSHKRISRKNLEKINLLIPSLNEQKRIGSFFKQLDHTITLQEQQLETLRKRKKAFLQKMFV